MGLVVPRACAVIIMDSAGPARRVTLPGSIRRILQWTEDKVSDLAAKSLDRSMEDYSGHVSSILADV